MSKNSKSRRQRNASISPIAHQTTTTETEIYTKDPTGSFLKTHSRWWVIALVVFLSLGVLGAGLKYLEDSAREEKVRRQRDPLGAKNESLLARINPFMPTPTPEPTPQLSKSYIYAESQRLLAVEDAAANAIPPSDLAVWRPSNGNWYCFGGPGSQQFITNWGNSGDKPVQGDYDGDGKTDLAIYRPPTGSGTGVWWIMKSSDASYYTVSLGAVDDELAPADYDGDGKTDPAVFRSSNTTWYMVQSSTQSTVTEQFGQSGDKPAPADYDGDGLDDIAAWRNSAATFYVLKSTDGQSLSQALGSTDDKPVPADYDGDGKADFAIRQGDNWIIKQSSNGQTNTIAWEPGKNSVPNDYDGDGKVDVAVWRPKNGNWYIRQSAHSNSLRQVAWGMDGDIPVPAYYRR